MGQQERQFVEYMSLRLIYRFSQVCIKSNVCGNHQKFIDNSMALKIYKQVNILK